VATCATSADVVVALAVPAPTKGLPSTTRIAARDAARRNDWRRPEPQSSGPTRSVLVIYPSSRALIDHTVTLCAWSISGLRICPGTVPSKVKDRVRQITNRRHPKMLGV